MVSILVPSKRDGRWVNIGNIDKCCCVDSHINGEQLMTEQTEKQAQAHAQSRKGIPRGKQKNEMTPERWKVLLQWTANGATRREACRACQVSRQTVQAYCISEPTALGDIRTAERAWIRRDWPIERIDEFLTWVSMGKTNIDAAKEMEFMDNELDQLMRVILHDPSVKKLYDEARQLQAETWADEMIDISDNAQGDLRIEIDRAGNPVARIDGENVRRSQLRIGTRQWLMARLHHERFGDRIQQNVTGELNVNHSDILDGARKRKEIADQKRKELTPHAVSEDTPPAAELH